jgi:hypothetical protein
VPVLPDRRAFIIPFTGGQEIIVGWLFSGRKLLSGIVALWMLVTLTLMAGIYIIYKGFSRLYQLKL